MSFWKKNYKKIIVISVAIIFTILTILIMTFRRPKTVTFLTASNDYFIVGQDQNNTFNSLIFCSTKKSSYLDMKNISQVMLKDRDTLDQYAIELVSINDSSEATYEDNNYYGYDCQFNIPYVINNLLLIRNAEIVFEYQNGENIGLAIGSMCIYNYQEEGKLHYSSLKGYTKFKSNQNILESVLIKLENSNAYTITKITPISNYASVELKDSSLIDTIPLADPDLYELVNTDEIKLNGSDYLLIRLKYQKLVEKALIGFIITYLDDNIEYEKIILPFKFFSTTSAPQMIKYEYTPN